MLWDLPGGCAGKPQAPASALMTLFPSCPVSTIHRSLVLLPIALLPHILNPLPAAIRSKLLPVLLEWDIQRQAAGSSAGSTGEGAAEVGQVAARPGLGTRWLGGRGRVGSFVSQPGTPCCLDLIRHSLPGLCAVPRCSKMQPRPVQRGASSRGTYLPFLCPPSADCGQHVSCAVCCRCTAPALCFHPYSTPAPHPARRPRRSFEQ